MQVVQRILNRESIKIFMKDKNETIPLNLFYNH